MAQFTLFPKLPYELQNLIWELAIPPQSTGAAYFARLTCQLRHRNEDGTPGTNGQSKTHIYYTAEQSNGLQHAPNRFISTLAALLTTCCRSADIAIAAYQLYQSKHVFTLRGLHHPIDTSSDLIIFQNGWQAPSKLYARTPAQYLEPTKPLRYIGVLWPGPVPGSCFYDFNGVIGFLRLWDALDTFYIVIDPEDLRQACYPWLLEEERQWESVLRRYEDRELEGLLGLYREAERMGSRIFRDGEREYFEVSADQVAQSGGLEDVGMLLGLAYETLVEEETPLDPATYSRCMILTWRPYNP
ncbi:hypothetical protein GQ53DRAFT_872020 [Thozetella sp. PMI_491]|nr:hypothetical protein GQ53DRAFT_872020 [Thozetella sp. PMI_491]